MNSTPTSTSPSTIHSKIFGHKDGLEVKSFVLTSESGISCEVCAYGATLTRLWMPNAQGGRDNLVLGYDDLEGYLSDPYFIGATVGRAANRIKNGKFELGGRSYKLECNNAPHHLHGGPEGWHTRIWGAEAGEWRGHPAVVFSLVSPDGDAGYPSEVTARVIYQLVDSDLRITMTASSQGDTLVNMANHAYFNLAGSGTVLDHKLQLHCSKFTPGAPIVPDGSIKPTAGSLLDFQKEKTIGKNLPEGGEAPNGYDHNLLIDRADGSALRQVAQVFEPGSGRKMSLSSNQPAVQFYTGNYLDGSREGMHGALNQYSGFCLETQAVPDAVNIPKFRDQVLLRKGEIYSHEMRFSFQGPEN